MWPVPSWQAGSFSYDFCLSDVLSRTKAQLAFLSALKAGEVAVVAARVGTAEKMLSLYSCRPTDGLLEKGGTL